MIHDPLLVTLLGLTSATVALIIVSRAPVDWLRRRLGIDDKDRTGDQETQPQPQKEVQDP